MRYLIHSSLAIPSARAILYDEAEKFVLQGHEVYFAYCDNLIDMCFINPQGSNADCEICKRNYQYEQKLLSKNVNFISLHKEMKRLSANRAHNSIKYVYNSIEDIKKIRHNEVNIGYACLSSYITATRNLTPRIDEEFRVYFDALINNSIKLCDALNLLIDEIRPDVLILYNGRLMENRPLWEIAQQRNIPFYTYELVQGLGSMYKSINENSIPHAIDYKTNLINKFWDDPIVTLSEKNNIGKSFFERRRNAQYTGDKIYTLGQKQGILPDNWDKNKRNIVFFNSSEDEFAAIGQEYENYSLYPSQLEGLKDIFDHFSQNTDIHFYLRIHPNLNDIRYKYHTDLYKLSNYHNVSVISSASAVSSYSLLDAANTVVVFGSTMGIESVYWGKPTILLCGAGYYKLNCCYIPHSKDDLYDLIQRKLQPRDPIQAIKYGYYLLNDQWTGPTYFDFNYSYKEFKFLSYKRKIGVNNWLKKFGSRTIYTIFRYSRDRLIKMLVVGQKHKLPIKEN